MINPTNPDENFEEMGARGDELLDQRELAEGAENGDRFYGGWGHHVVVILALTTIPSREDGINNPMFLRQLSEVDRQTTAAPLSLRFS